MHVDPVHALKQIALYLERAGEPTHKVQAFRRAAATIAALPPGELDQRLRAGTLTALPGIGKTTGAVITEAAGGGEPGYLTERRAYAQLHCLASPLVCPCNVATARITAL